MHTVDLLIFGKLSLKKEQLKSVFIQKNCLFRKIVYFSINTLFLNVFRIIDMKYLFEGENVNIRFISLRELSTFSFSSDPTRETIFHKKRIRMYFSCRKITDKM